jgi:alpha-mannosidase
MRIVGTELFIGAQQVVRVHEVSEPSTVTVTGPGVTGTAEGRGTVEVPVTVDAPPGTVIPVTATAGGASVPGELVVAEPGWTVWMVSHFHYDPVWWNTQAAYTATWGLPGQTGTEFRGDFQRTGFELVRLHLETARRDPEYKFVLAELDYLKPYWDAYPQDRAYVRRLLDEGRLELVGGTYNEPNTNLTTAETTIRNFLYGIGFQRDVVGGDPRSAWQLDAFGHDPNFPGLAADAGLDSSSWARGPFHQWGPMQTTHTPGSAGWGDPSSMQFKAEFEWLSPNGRGVLTHYMPAHYSSGWHIDAQPTLAAAEENVYQLFLLLKKVASSKNVLLPVGTDYSPPAKWVVDIHRDWNARYTWPRFVCGLPKEFFAAARAEVGPGFSPQTRDMNPVYTGKDVSFIDTKQAQRHAEALLSDAEMFATLAALHGRPFPHHELDQAWRQLVFNAHHDGITGSESDQVYLDLLTGWREAFDLAGEVLDGALATLVKRLPGGNDASQRVAVFNPSAWTRTDVVRLPTTLAGATVDGQPALVDDGHLVFLAADVPSVGYRTYAISPHEPQGWQPLDGYTIGNDTFRITVDPARGGAVSSIVDLRKGRELLPAGRVGNELLVYDEYPAHPQVHEGPWHLLPKGPAAAGSADAPATSVVVETSALGQRVTVTGAVGPARYTQELTLWAGVDRVDAVTHIDEFTGADQLIRLRWPAQVPGALPVSEVGNAVVGRGFGLIDVDSDPAPWTLDNPANHWFALSSTARVSFGDAVRAIGVAEIITQREDARELALALVRQGVTATTSVDRGTRYGLLAVDSNLPDVRIALGGPDTNAFTAEVLATDPAFAEEAQRQLAETGRLRLWVPARTPLAEVWVPNADLTDVRALPVLIVAGEGAVARLSADVAAGDIRVEQPVELCAPADCVPDPEFDDYTVGLVNRGMPGFAVDRGGALHVSLMRSCTGWPSGVWIDPPRRCAPDGSNFQQQHWSHSFEYSLVAGPGDWRAAGLVTAGQEVNHPLYARPAEPGPAAAESFVTVEPARQVVLTALKPGGNAIATGQRPGLLDRVTARVYEATGRPVTGSLELPVPIVDSVPVDLLEKPNGDRVSEAAPVRLEAAGIGQLSLGVSGGAGVAPVERPPAYAKYWLHNVGPAPIGNMPVSVHLDPPHATVTGPVTLRVTLSSDLTEERAAGTVAFTLPPGWSVEPSTVDYDLEPGGHRATEVVVTPADGAADGVYWVRAAISDASFAVYDVARLLLGADEPESLEVTLEPSLRLAPGEPGALTLRLRTDAATPIAVEAQVISPWHTWELIDDPAFTVELDGSAEVEIPVKVPVGHRAGSWWVLVRLAHAGQLHYSTPVKLEVTA